MRDVNRIDRILDKLRVLWKQHPDLRLHQLLFNIHKIEDAFYLEDDKFEKLLDYELEEYDKSEV